MTITLDKFIENSNGKYRDYDGAFGFQCVDLFLFYLKEVLGIDPKPYQGWGTAKNIFNNFNNIKDASKHFVFVKNGPTNFPTKGDILFFGYPFGFYMDGLIPKWAGHVCIVSGANSMTSITFDENFGKPSFCKFVNHNYKGALGWWHLKS